MPTLVLLRHGESDWNARNCFTGWVDVGLTARGEEQARRSGRLLRAAGLRPTRAHTSVLTRAVRTAELTLEAAGGADAPTSRGWRLNERHYGALQGQDRRTVRMRYGDEQFRALRRGYDAAPPRCSADEHRQLCDDPRYADVPRELLPWSESLADVVTRLLPHWRDVIAPDLHAGHTVLVCAHGNSLRALIGVLDRLSPDELAELNVPTGMPLVYVLDPQLGPTLRGGRYLEPEAARRAALAVAEQGQ